MGDAVESKCRWFLRDMTSMPAGSIGTDDSLGEGVPAPSVLLLFITGHGLKAMSPWLKREWTESHEPFAIVTCVESLDVCVDYNDGVAFDESDANPDGWNVYRDPIHAKYGVFVVPPKGTSVDEWAKSAPVPKDSGPDAVADSAPAIIRNVLGEDDVRAVEALAAKLDAGKDEVLANDASEEALAMRLANAMESGGENTWSEVEDTYHSLPTHRITHLHAGGALSADAPGVRAKLLRAAFDADARDALDGDQYYCFTELWREMGAPRGGGREPYEPQVVRRHCGHMENEFRAMGKVHPGVVEHIDKENPTCSCEWGFGKPRDLAEIARDARTCPRER